MTTKNKAAPAMKRQMRFELDEKNHHEARLIRAQTNLENEELWNDMMRVYKKHPNEWITAAK